MKKVKKIVSFICAFSIAFMSVSCNEKEENQNSGTKNLSIAQQCVYRGKNIELVEPGDSLIDFEVADDQITFTKLKNEELAQISTFDLVNFEVNSYDFNLSDFEEGLCDYPSIYSNEQKFYLVNEFVDKTVIYIVDKEKLTISSVVVPEISAQSFCVDNKDMFYLSYYVYDIQSKSVIIDIYSDGQKYKTVNLSEILSDSNNICVCDMYVDGDDNLYVLYTLNDEVYIAKLGNNGDVISNSIVDGIFGQLNNLITSENGRFFVVNRAGAGEILINEIDPQTCQTIEYYEENTVGVILDGVSGYDYIVYDNNTFTGIKINEGISEDLYESSDGFENVNICEDEGISFGVKFRYDSSFIKADKNTYEVISQTKINLGDDCYIIDSCYKNQEYIYLCGDDNTQFMIFTDENGNVAKREEINIGENIYLSCIETDGDNIYALATDYEECNCIKFDKNMDFISEVSVDSVKGDFKILYADNELYGCNGDLYKIDFADNKAVKLDVESTICDIYQHNDGLAVKDEKGRIYIYDDSDMSEIINTSELSFLNSNQISQIEFVDENNFLVYSDISGKLQMVNTLNESELENISVINIASDIESTELKNIISEFNAENDDTVLVLSDYSTDEKLEQLNMEIANGNIPDIIVSNGRMDMSIYENMGVLEDLTSYIENDKTINIDDYYTNIFRACSSQGKITQIVPFYTIVTAVGKSSVLSENMGWNYSEFSNFVMENSSKDILYRGWFHEGMDYRIIPYYVFSDFIDTKNKKIEINPEFAQLLSVCKSHISEPDDEEVYYDKNKLSSGYDMRFRNDTCLMEVTEIYSIDELCNLKDAIINEDIVLKGLPADNSNGSYVCPKLKLSMLTTCKEKEKAWNFIRKYLDDEYQKQLNISGFPVKKDAFEMLYSKCEERKHYVGEMICDVHVPNKEYKDMISAWIGSVTDSVCSEKRISDIVIEELEKYFGDQQNEEETIKELERKIELYMSEVL
ncbi:MAG: carbohydrate ABC transporter substrate-binding protein [Ruminococcus sp.]|nr:carbohydrate ABC transporter substrate-binding protein [Ruminococcus sp.]